MRLLLLSQCNNVHKKEGRETPLLYQIVNSVSTYQINPKEPAVIPTATKKLNSKMP